MAARSKSRKRSSGGGVAHARAARPTLAPEPRWDVADSVLMWAAAAAIAVTVLFASRIFAATGMPWSVAAVVVLGVIGVALAWLRDRGPVRLLRAIAPVLVLAVVDGFVYWVTGVRLHASALAYFRALLAPACFVAAAVLGYTASRRGELAPLVVAAATAWASVVAAAFGLAQRAGLASPLTGWYAAWNAAAGAWQPGPSDVFRAVGFEVDPNTFGLIGVVCLVVALALTSHVRLRIATAVGATLVIAASGSRTALVAALLAAVVAAVPVPVGVETAKRRGRELAPLGIAIAVTAAVLALAIVATGGPAGTLQRLGTSATAIESAGQTGASAAADEALSGRVQIWTRALAAYSARPMGVFQPPESLLSGRSVHNEYIERLLYGGPLMLAAFLLLLAWLAARSAPASAPSLGRVLAVAWGVSAMMLGPTLSAPFMAMAFFLVGWGRGTRAFPRRTGE